MESETKPNETAAMGRRTLMKAGTVGAAAAVAGVGATVVTASAASAAPGGKPIVLDVDTHGFSDFQGAAPGGAFYVSGEITPPGGSLPGDKIGDFHCWGFIRSGDELGVVNQEFDLTDWGKILIAGVESDAPRAVTGGTGAFANAHGQGIPDVGIFDFPNSCKFRIAFNLTGAVGQPII